MNLAQLLNNVSVSKMFQTVFGKMVTTHDVEINRICYDSRKVERGDLFVAINGTIDGHKFIQDAISRGAKGIVIENDKSIDDSFCMHTGVVKIVVENTRIALAKISANYFKNPASKLQIIGVTGTNGKTTVVNLIKQLLAESTIPNVKIGVIGTINYSVGGEMIPSTHTTPESLELNYLFSKMVSNNCTHCVMEVSSHSLIQKRVFGINFAAAVFTNLTQDHLDFHNTMDEYFKAKKILFDNLSSGSIAITNVDSDFGEEIVKNTNAKIIRYSIEKKSELKAEEISLSTSESNFKLKVNDSELNLKSKLIGKFNIYNILASIGAITGLGIKFKKDIHEIIPNLESAAGRFQKINSPFGWSAIVDYAHTPDALEKCLSAIKDTLNTASDSSIITVFGAGGDRDSTKRPKMGEIAERFSDKIVVTSDNPRTEDPQKIIDDILLGMKSSEKIFVDVDRHDAIFRALSLADLNDVVLIAGKGHEDYQVIGHEKIHFNDVEVVEEFIELNK